MSADLRLPSITAQTLPGQIQQIQSYLFQLVQQLEYAFDALWMTAPAAAVQAQTTESTGDPSEMEAQAIFNSIKPLIMRSADIIKAYYQKMSEMMKGEYVSQSDYTSFASATNTALKNLSDAVDPLTDHIRAGVLYRDEDGASVRGLEIGRWTGTGEEKIFEKFARFIPGRTSFYDGDGNEIAWITGGKVYFADDGWVDLGLSGSVSESVSLRGRAADTGCHYRVCPGEHHVYVAFNCAFEYSGNPVQVNANALPAVYCPQRDVCSICVANGGAMACVTVTSSGNVLVEWVRNADDTTASVIEWLDGYLDYWI